MKLVTGKFCMPCKMLKQWLDENNIKVDEVLSDDIMDEVDRLGIKKSNFKLLKPGVSTILIVSVMFIISQCRVV